MSGTPFSENQRRPLLKDWKREEFSIGRPFGKSQFGYTVVARHKKTMFNCALSYYNNVEMLQAGKRDEMIDEINYLFAMKHPRIQRIFGFFSDDSGIYTILQRGTSDNLYKYMDSKEKLEEKEAASYLRQTILALIYLHDTQGITHGNIRPEQLIKCNKKIILSGIGPLTRNNFDKMRGDNISLSYNAPEKTDNEDDYDFRVDIWSLGVLMYEMLAGVKRKSIQNSGLQLDGFSLQAVGLLPKMIAKEPNNRASLSEILKSDWMTANRGSRGITSRVTSPEMLPQESHKKFGVFCPIENRL